MTKLTTNYPTFYGKRQVYQMITHTLKFRYAQYMGNHMKIIFLPLTPPHYASTIDRDTWPHLLSTFKKTNALKASKLLGSTKLYTSSPKHYKPTNLLEPTITHHPTPKSQNGSSNAHVDTHHVYA